MSLSPIDDTANNPNSDMWLISGDDVGLSSATRNAEIGGQICECIVDNALKYATSTNDGVSLGFFAFVWNALYYLVADTVEKRGLKQDVVNRFTADAFRIFTTVDNQEDVRKFLVAVHEVVLEDMSKANISTNNKDGILRAHQMALILANEAKFYDGNVIPSSSQENAFLLAATRLKRGVESILNPPPPAPAPRPQASAGRPASSGKDDHGNISCFVWMLAVLAVVILVAAIVAGFSSEQDSGSPGHATEGAQLPQEPRPRSGELLLGSFSDESEITVTTTNYEDCVVMLKSNKGVTKLAFYVRAGDTVTVGVPAGYFYVYFASGEDWYGYGEGLMFGKHTSYSMDDELLDFFNYTWEYTLRPVTDGNFSETPIDEDEFFD